MFFLSAPKPIVKSYTLENDTVVTHPYPFIYEVTSFEIKTTTMEELHHALTQQSKLNRCALKGELQRPLIKESRAGSTNANLKTDWICLDLDGIENYQDVPAFLHEIGCQDIDHVIQWSSSMGIENKAGFRCHIFLFLTKPAHPQLLKNWLMGLNLNTPTLRAQLRLTSTGNALRWPLDVTTCQNDKLIYIAPPQLAPGINNPFAKKERIELHLRKHRALTLPIVPNRETLRVQIDTRVAELREEANMPKKRKTKYKFEHDVEYLASPDSATITDIKQERGFVYFNLNGGDSWGYYHAEDNPTFIHNFKGEPSYKTEELLPEYWASLQTARAARAMNSSSGELTYLAFRDFHSSNYYNGTYNPATKTISLALAKSESQLRQFMKQHNQYLPKEYIPDWNIVFEPHNKEVIDLELKTINSYQPPNISAFKGKASLPPTIQQVIHHALGEDQATTDHFINWLACIVQHLDRTGTAWVLQGTQGTGKGILFHHILTPLFGEQNVVAKRMEELESEFTGFMENKFVVFIDEIQTGSSMYHSKITAKLKNLIVEPTISIRKMYCPPYMAPNFSNMVFASNKPEPVEISPDDRRFNVGSYQRRKIHITHTILETIHKELSEFYSYLYNYDADRQQARTPLINDSRQELINIGRAAVDTVSDAFKAGDLKFFWDQLPATKPTGFGSNVILYDAYRAIIHDILTTGRNAITREELFTLCEWCLGNMPQSPNKFAALLKHHDVVISPVWINGRTVRGLHIDWLRDELWIKQCQTEMAAGLV